MEEVGSIPETETTFICFVLFPLASCTFSLGVKGYKSNKETSVFLLFFHWKSKFHHHHCCQNGTKEEKSRGVLYLVRTKVCLSWRKKDVIRVQFLYNSSNVLAFLVLCILNKILEYFHCLISEYLVLSILLELTDLSLFF